MLAPPVLRLAFRPPTGDQIRQNLLSSLLFQDTMVLSPKTTRLLLLPVNESQELYSKVRCTRKENQLLIMRDFRWSLKSHNGCIDENVTSIFDLLDSFVPMNVC